MVPSKWFVQKSTQGTPPVSARVTVVESGESKTMVDEHHHADFSTFHPDGWTPALDETYRVELVEDGGAVFAAYETTFIDCR
jgi:hypothetical protein